MVMLNFIQIYSYIQAIQMIIFKSTADNGATTITTNDNTSNVAHLTLDIDGFITLNLMVEEYI